MFGLFKRKRNKRIAYDVAATRHARIASDSLKLVRSTLNPKTFFGRCDDIAAVEARLTGTSTFKDDLDVQTALQIEFIDRVIAAGRAKSFKTDMAAYEWRLTPDAMLHYVMNIEE